MPRKLRKIKPKFVPTLSSIPEGNENFLSEAESDSDGRISAPRTKHKSSHAFKEALLQGKFVTEMVVKCFAIRLQ